MTTSDAITPHAEPGDWLVILPRGLGDHGRRGLILEVIGRGEHEHYRVRWDEEHESLFYPSDGYRIEHGKHSGA